MVHKIMSERMTLSFKLLEEIREHMTIEEKKEEKKLAGIYGRWAGYTFTAIFLFPCLILISYSHDLVIMPILYFVIFESLFISSYVISQYKSSKKQKKFYSSTTWAKSQGYKPEDIIFSDILWEAPKP